MYFSPKTVVITVVIALAMFDTLFASAEIADYEVDKVKIIFHSVDLLYPLTHM
jgi:hypothetical protein